MPQSATLGLHPVIHVPNYMDHYSFTDSSTAAHKDGWLSAEKSLNPNPIFILLVALVVVSGAILNTHLYLYLFTAHAPYHVLNPNPNLP